MRQWEEELCLQPLEACAVVAGPGRDDGDDGGGGLEGHGYRAAGAGSGAAGADGGTRAQEATERPSTLRPPPSSAGPTVVRRSSVTNASPIPTTLLTTSCRNQAAWPDVCLASSGRYLQPPVAAILAAA
uniref:Uncharacterized protein n=1 Tax=Oryza sativa subsp. japonica TaxID=39947 RepID=Q69U99_ORYSJ|nr:hypothetical protein [Oryza sativa Japonica Group]